MTRVIKNEKEKKIASVLTPFIPCSAKLPMISLFSTYFFREKSGLVALSFYFLAIGILLLSCVLLKKIYPIKHIPYLLLEMPAYHMPKVSQVLKDTFHKVLDFIKRVGSVIFVSSLVTWTLLSYSPTFEYGVDVSQSLLALLGKKISWLFLPMVGKASWELAVCSIQGLVAKEQILSSMAIMAGLEMENVTNSLFVNGSPFQFLTPAAAYAFVCFNLFNAPCFSAIGAMKKTLGSTKSTVKAVIYQIGISYIISCLLYGTLSLLGGA